MNEMEKYNVPMLIIFKAFLIRALMSGSAERMAQAMAWVVFVVVMSPVIAGAALLVVRIGWQIAFLF